VDGVDPTVLPAEEGPFCPQKKDQVIGLTRCGQLLRSRTRWLGELAGPAPDHQPLGAWNGRNPLGTDEMGAPTHG